MLYLQVARRQRKDRGQINAKGFMFEIVSTFLGRKILHSCSMIMFSVLRLGRNQKYVWFESD